MGLGAFILKRFVGAVLVVIGVTILTFFLVHLAPGNPIRTALGQHASPDEVTQLARLRARPANHQPVLRLCGRPPAR
jgi:ABC-type dipeptide/oligopeptide/nickel transport system permease component